MHWTAEDKKAHEAMGFHDGWGQSLDRLGTLVTEGSHTTDEAIKTGYQAWKQDMGGTAGIVDQCIGRPELRFGFLHGGDQGGAIGDVDATVQGVWQAQIVKAVDAPLTSTPRG